MSSRKIFNYESKILIDETIKEFGYHPDDFGRTSSKKIIATCRFCGKNHIVSKGNFNKSGSACHKSCKIEEMKLQDSPFANPEIRKRIEEENLKVHGVKHASQRPEIANKISMANKRPETQKQKRKTNLERYGAEVVFQSEEIKEKIAQINIERYGNASPIKTPQIKEKSRQTCLERFGEDNPMKVKEIKEKAKETCLERYGEDNPLKVDFIREKAKNTIIETYGFDHPMKHPDVIQKMTETCLERYNAVRPSANPTIKAKIMKSFADAVANDINGNFKVVNTLRNNDDFWQLLKDGKTLKFACEQFDINDRSVGNYIRSQEFKDKFDEYLKKYESMEQRELYDIVCSLVDSEVLYNDRTTIAPYELDIYVPDLKIAIEYCGNIWHSDYIIKDEKEASTKHFNKLKLCREKGIRLFTLFSHIWKERQIQFLNLLKTNFSVNTEKVGARECEITYDPCPEFFESYHIQGVGFTPQTYINLVHKGEIIASVIAARHHRNPKPGEIVLSRLCFKDGINVQGGASKLFKALKDWSANNGYHRIISWSDNCWSDGNIYKVLGFNFKTERSPQFFYWDVMNGVSALRQNYTKEKMGCPKDIKEHEFAREKFNLYRIWDCGLKVWTYDLNEVLS